MPAPVAGIHAFVSMLPQTSVDGRDEPGHDSGKMFDDRNAL
jgi:hypothetical protein